MRSPDQHTFTPISPDQKEHIRRQILFDMRRTIQRLEPLYLDHEEVERIQNSPLTQTRYRLFEKWLAELTKKGSSVRTSIDRSKLTTDISQVVQLYEALADLKHDRPISERNQRRYDLAPDEFLLEPEDIPRWNELPSEEALKTTFRLDWVFGIDYSEGRSLRDFELKEHDLLVAGYAEHDPAKREAFLLSIDVDHFTEALPPARIFDITKIIEEKQKQDSAHSDALSTQELLEAFDEAGVRPAILKELLAYSRKYWIPEQNPTHPWTKEEIDQSANSRYIHALGTACTYTKDIRTVPCLDYRENIRKLDGSAFYNHWRSEDKFLVFRREV